MTGRQRGGLVVLATVQVVLAVAAWLDLARRDPQEINGSKGKWAAAIAVNFIGPVAYFTRGRRAAL
ncbi:MULTISPECIES: PLDc N-terminal domain-containing protein [Rhodococcus]|uniref:PLDc N-terminal domain-containing protein n=1 Tax=Rhodococcus oxybenzonivorans TaxID=1990687 RepID=A0AAE4V3H9_9NOCA|nr:MULTISPECIES: PLDc N-terminal domain-containing protein [Rhodococcus]MDV7245290.1 PLDc N-terminal domain-containing protein [Rhodococcus oxybenzonivorans]MDV7267104.1 PLDc N-terminal domain-containing protein [Rhodococcus oxybenzonivorans]MDV7272430.1 PLDc N-terminal domain-containing protein [Rhodococcus oxybenzonivorans]MDV7336315.1 PLDc N-terminal domain-containing protein [Rhodococcus oxybenzonivorans]MDV7347615.1 PLDc N-terminal domain-containing protein [Rhodococcus oxybenzonivorans]